MRSLGNDDSGGLLRRVVAGSEILVNEANDDDYDDALQEPVDGFELLDLGVEGFEESLLVDK